jgi:hypothetical protein
MGRYIDIRPDDEELPSELVLAAGDVVRFSASGARISSGTAVELLGVLTEGVVGTDGSILAPLGAPSTVLLRARVAGHAVVEVVSGDPFGSTITRSIVVRVEP